MRNINLIKKSIRYNHIYQNINIGEYYEDCAYRPMLCTENDGDTIIGISLIDGSIHSCSVQHCAPIKMTFNQALERKENWEEFIKPINDRMIKEGWRTEDNKI